eukprot:Sspe_Gene.95137::Locus_67450_Transcript_1_1_Confidence_1.000_Length_1448::g.95137::m.95137
MQMLRDITTTVKRGKQQMMQKMGQREMTRDSEYDEARKHVHACRAVFKDVLGDMKNLVKAIGDMCAAFEALSNDFTKFWETTQDESLDTNPTTTTFLTDSVTELQRQARIFGDTVYGNSSNIIQMTLKSLEAAEGSHSEIKQVRLDMDTLRHEVRTLNETISDSRLQADRVEKARTTLTTRQGDLDKVTQRHELLTREAKKDMYLSTSDASSSLWSVYTIVFQQTQQHFVDMAQECSKLLQNLSKAKQAHKERDPVIVQAARQSKADPRPAPTPQEADTPFSFGAKSPGTVDLFADFNQDPPKGTGGFGGSFGEQPELVLRPQSPGDAAIPDPFGSPLPVQSPPNPEPPSSAGSPKRTPPAPPAQPKPKSPATPQPMQQTSVEDLFHSADAPPPPIPLGEPKVEEWKPDWGQGAEDFETKEFSWD